MILPFVILSIGLYHTGLKQFVHALTGISILHVSPDMTDAVSRDRHLLFCQYSASTDMSLLHVINIGLLPNIT